jgi:hypothetical protein
MPSKHHHKEQKSFKELEFGGKLVRGTRNIILVAITTFALGVTFGSTAAGVHGFPNLMTRKEGLLGTPWKEEIPMRLKRYTGKCYRFQRPWRLLEVMPMRSRQNQHDPPPPSDCQSDTVAILAMLIRSSLRLRLHCSPWFIDNRYRYSTIKSIIYSEVDLTLMPILVLQYCEWPAFHFQEQKR